MRVRSVWISQYKNLCDFSIEFEGEGFIDIFVGKIIPHDALMTLSWKWAESCGHWTYNGRAIKVSTPMGL